MLLEELVSALPRASSQALLTASGQLTSVTQANPRFVAPTLSEVVALKPGTTSIVVVSAAAAVGKSTVAQHVAYATGAALWDLAGRRVGTQSLTGALTGAFGVANVSDAFEALEAGRLLVVLDALDETLLGSGASNFEAFLEDVVQFGLKPRARPTLLLLSRADTAELIELALALGDVPFAHYRIEFFDLTTAVQFVDRALADRGKSGKAYADARDRLFALVYKLLESGDDPWKSSDVKAFLGYAPVLQTIVNYLDVPNPLVRANEFEQAAQELTRAGAAGAWDFLTRLIEDLLERERSEKVLPALQQRLAAQAKAAGWSAWPTLFRSDEQTSRVLEANLGEPLPARPPASLPPELRSEYEQAIDEWLASHVFRGPVAGYANVAFRDYSFALELARSGPLALHVRQRMRQVDYLPTPLFARFLLHMAGAEGGQPVVSGDLVGFVYESLTSQVEEPGNLELHIWADTDLHAALYSGGSRKETEFRIDYETSSVVWFWRRLRYADVQVRGTIEIGAHGSPFLLGPAVLVECDQIKWVASEAFVTTRKDDDVELASRSFDQTSTIPSRIEVEGDGTFRIDWPTPAYPWLRYRVQGAPGTDLPRQLLDDFHLLRSALRRFRSQGYGTLARHRDIIDGIVFGNSPRGRALVRFLMEQGILTRDGDMYVLNRDRLNELGMNWSDVTEYRISDRAAELLRRFDRGVPVEEPS